MLQFKVSAPNNSVCLASSPNVFTTSINTKILQGTTVTNSTGSSTHVPRTIEDTSGFFDDPTNITLLIIAAGVAGLWAVLVIGYILVSYLIKNTSLCAR